MDDNNSGKRESAASLKCGTAGSDVIPHRNPYHHANITKISVAHNLLYFKDETPKMKSMHIHLYKGEPDHAEQKAIYRKP